MLEYITFAEFFDLIYSLVEIYLQVHASYQKSEPVQIWVDRFNRKS